MDVSHHWATLEGTTLMHILYTKRQYKEHVWTQNDKLTRQKCNEHVQTLNKEWVNKTKTSIAVSQLKWQIKLRLVKKLKTLDGAYQIYTMCLDVHPCSIYHSKTFWWKDRKYVLSEKKQKKANVKVLAEANHHPARNIHLQDFSHKWKWPIKIPYLFFKGMLPISPHTVKKEKEKMFRE